MKSRLDWSLDGQDWPHRAHSRFVPAGDLMWHIQEWPGPAGDVVGTAVAADAGVPSILLVHGTAAATHSWRGLAPILARHGRVLSLDLPGHGFTSPFAHGVMSLTHVATALEALLRTLGFTPDVSIGHSAGAAILAQMSLEGMLPALHPIVSINGALQPFGGGVASRFFSPLAKALAANPLVGSLVNWRAGDTAAVARVIANTGSTLDAEGLALYARLFRDPGHVAAAFSMMANWDLAPLLAAIPRLSAPLTLIACGNDTAVPPAVAFMIKDRLPAARVAYVRGLGHLAHEECADALARIIVRASIDHHQIA